MPTIIPGSSKLKLSWWSVRLSIGQGFESRTSCFFFLKALFTLSYFFRGFEYDCHIMFFLRAELAKRQEMKFSQWHRIKPGYEVHFRVHFGVSDSIFVSCRRVHDGNFLKETFSTAYISNQSLSRFSISRRGALCCLQCIIHSAQVLVM